MTDAAARPGPEQPPPAPAAATSATVRAADPVPALPADVTAAHTLDRLVSAIGELRTLLVRKTALFTLIAANIDDDPVRKALLEGQARAYSAAIGHLHTSIVAEFGFWDQYEC